MRSAYFYVLTAVTVLLAGCSPALVELYAVRDSRSAVPPVATANPVAEAAQPTATATAVPEPTPTAVATETPAPEAADGSAVAESPVAEPAVDAALVERGVQVYRQQYCGICHVLDPLETRGTFGPPHNGLGITAAERVRDPGYTGQATTAAEYLRESIVAPDAYFVEGYVASAHRMPPYSHLDPADVDALVALLLSQR